MALAADDPRHGSMNAYKNLRCRCASCTAAWAAWCKARRARVQLPPDDERHGKPGTYQNYACRCAKCRATKAREGRERYAATRPA